MVIQEEILKYCAPHPCLKEIENQKPVKWTLFRSRAVNTRYFGSFSMLMSKKWRIQDNCPSLETIRDLGGMEFYSEVHLTRNNENGTITLYGKQDVTIGRGWINPFTLEPFL